MCWEQRKQHYLPPWGNGANINTDTQILTHVPMGMCAFIHSIISVRVLGVNGENLESRSGQETSVFPCIWTWSSPVLQKAWVTRLWLLLRWPLLEQCTSVKKGRADESPHVSLPFCTCLQTQATDGPCVDQKQECDWGRWLIWWRETFAFLPRHRDNYSDATFYGQPCK